MAPAQKSKDFRGSFRRLIQRLRPERTRIAVVFVLAIVSVTFAVIGPKILGNATNDIFAGLLSKQIPAGVSQDQVEAALRAQGKGQLADMLSTMHLTPGQGVDFGALGQVLMLLIGVYLLSSLFSWMQAWIMAGVTQRTVYRLRQDVDSKLGRLPLRYFDSHPRGDLLSRVTNDIDNIGQTLQQSLTQLITSLLTIIGVLALMLTISWELAVISILAVPASIILTIVIASRSQKQFVAQWASTGSLNGHIEEMHTGHSVVKLFGRQAEAIETFDRENAKLYDASYRAQFISGTIQPAMNFISNLNYVAIAVIGGVRVATGQMSLGDVIAFIQYSRQFTFPIVQTASIANVLQSAVASAERVFELLDEPEEIADPVEPIRLPSTRGAVAFDDISFRYEPDKPLIDDLSLVADAGHTIAIVGPTGAGKTTLVNLLMRFYELDSGRITIDGVDTRDMTRDDLRRTFGMVLQDTWLFHGTIRENIAYGCDGASEEEIIHAAEAAHVDHFVRTLPDGYDTVIDDEATNLSAGEKQLLTIARAFLADPAILILDEATSSVDTRTEVLIQKAMARLMHGRTAFVIAHRLSTIRDADTILVMNRGAIVEQGNHEELLARGGFYAELYNSQFSEALAEAV
ncbi:MAG TPA: ABC transporter ATP-binding protein [Candidatus Limnocylindrales bacterium]|nr:ABC transporter ATP-binding protein [Candidatus Limnocylindrales bacterium]